MSIKHPIVAVTGSSGAGTTNFKTAFEYIFRQEGINPAIIEGDCFHRYSRKEMDKVVEEAAKEGRNITHFGPDGNLFEELEAVFREYAKSGIGKRRYYIHNEDEAALHGALPGELTTWEPLPENTDLLFYEGLHGGVVTDKADVARHVDLLIGVAPIINLEWIQKIYRDKSVRGYTIEDATNLILSRMYDYTHYITPQFSRTDINFQRVPTVDTSNPFAASEIPGNDKSFSVIHIRNINKIPVDFDQLLKNVEYSFMSAPDTIVVPSARKIAAIKLILTPVIHQMLENRNNGR